MKTRTAVLIAASALVLAGCGLRGDLERPAPMWGSQEAEADSPSTQAPPDPNAPVPIAGPRN